MVASYPKPQAAQKKILRKGYIVRSRLFLRTAYSLCTMYVRSITSYSSGDTRVLGAQMPPNVTSGPGQAMPVQGNSCRSAPINHILYWARPGYSNNENTTKYFVQTAVDIKTLRLPVYMFSIRIRETALRLCLFDFDGSATFFWSYFLLNHSSVSSFFSLRKVSFQDALSFLLTSFCL